MRRKKALYIFIITVFCAFLVFICYIVFSIALDGFHKVVSSAEKVQVAGIDKEIAFLTHIQNRLNNLENCNLLKNEIDRRLALLKKQRSNVLAESDIQKFAKVLSDQEREWVSLKEQIQFLAASEKKLNECKESPVYASVKNEISEKIVTLRMRLSYWIAGGTNDSVSRLTGEVPEYFYVPHDAIKPLRIAWSNGGGAVLYEIMRKFPAEEMLAEFSQHYANLGWKPLEYDLCQALEPGGLKGGWRKGTSDFYFWSQFWINESKDIINVSVSYYGRNKAHVVITHSKNWQIQPALDYYYTIHDVSGVEPRSEIVKMILKEGYKFFLVRPIQ